ncbi:MAG TPA: cyclomaltodextrinase C-terminal domain-containing protein, partial [Puia sp.]|nr:cyclomaltodextrinase C-terminal domain-containing protein [Puia sp.]
WPGDTKSGFTGEGLTQEQLAVQQLVKQLGNFRLHSSALRTGKLMQYTPQGGLYVYFRYDDRQTVLCAMNNGTKPLKLDFSRFSERTAGFTRGVDVLNGESHALDQPAEIPARTMWVLELRK